MSYAGVRVATLESLDDGFLLSFEPSGPRGEAAKAVRSLDPWQRHWIPALRAWWVADDAVTKLARRLPALADALEAWRARPRDYMAEALASDYWRRLRPNRPLYVPLHVASAYHVLGLDPGSPAEQVIAARRAQARRHHPDSGGNHEAMVAINHAADTVLEWLAATPASATRERV
ncbi:MAG TPA: hypothetical protein VF120_13165 [Ktedonobacterales bacterium]